MSLVWLGLSGQTGGSDPTKLFGRLKAEKVGSLPPVLVVFRPLLLKFLLGMFLFLRTFGGERVKTLVQTKLQREFFTIFTGDARLIRRPPCERWACGGRRIAIGAEAITFTGLRFELTWLRRPPQFVPVT